MFLVLRRLVSWLVRRMRRRKRKPAWVGGSRRKQSVSWFDPIRWPPQWGWTPPPTVWNWPVGQPGAAEEQAEEQPEPREDEQVIDAVEVAEGRFVVPDRG